MVPSLALALIFAQEPTPTYDFVRNVKPGTVLSYEIKLSAGEDGQDFGATGTTKFVFKKTLADGRQEWEASITKGTISQGSNNSDFSLDGVVLALDRAGFPEAFPVKDMEIPLGVNMILGLSPNGSLKVGEVQKVDWKSKDKAQTYKGSFKLAQVGEKTVTLEAEGAMTPENDSEGVLKWRSEIDRATGWLISAKGNVKIEEMDIKLEVKQIP